MKFLRASIHICRIYICNRLRFTLANIHIYIVDSHTHTRARTTASTFVRLLLKGRAVQIIPGNCSSNGKRNSSINVSSRFSWLITWKTDERPRHKIPESSTKLIKRPFRRPAPFHFTLWSGAYRIDGDGIGRLSPSIICPIIRQGSKLLFLRFFRNRMKLVYIHKVITCIILCNIIFTRQFLMNWTR